MCIFKGAATALLTPFHSDGRAIDYEAFGRLIDWQIAEGIDGLVVAGTTGETAAISEQEHQELITFAVRRTAKRVPLIAGTGSNNFNYTLRMTQFAEKAGADAVLIVNPYYNKTTQKGLIAHYTAIHEGSTIPIILYNVPSRTGMNIAPQTVAELSKLDRIIGVKEASNQFSQITEIARLTEPTFALYSGNDDTVIPLLALGGCGVISVASNIIPNIMHTLVTAYQAGDYQKALSLQLSYKDLIDALFLETNPAPVKWATAYLGRPLGPLRLPMVEIEPTTQDKVTQALLAHSVHCGW